VVGLYLLVQAVRAFTFGEDRRYAIERKRRFLLGYRYEYRLIAAERATGGDDRAGVLSRHSPT